MFEQGYPQVETFRKFRKINKMDVKFQSLQSKRVEI
ncbi:MAG: decaprenylphospho-beta-D-ribofuranose 2-oxidase [Glaciecola sp.]